MAGCCECGCEPSGSVKDGEFLDQLGSCLFSGRTVAYGVHWLVKLLMLCGSRPAEAFLTYAPGMCCLECLKFDGRSRAIIRLLTLKSWCQLQGSLCRTQL